LFLSTLKFVEYPASIYKGIVRVILIYIVPLLTIANIPAQYVLGGISTRDILFSFLIMIVLMIICRTFWKISLKRYQSASSFP